MYEKTSRRACSCVMKSMSRTSSVLSVAKKLSATALSQQLPLRLMLAMSEAALLGKHGAVFGTLAY